MKHKSILLEADNLVNGERQKAYGKPENNFKHISEIVSSVLKKKVTAREIVIMLICTKMSRHIFKPKRDNLTDLAGYAEILSRIEYQNIDSGREADE